MRLRHWGVATIGILILVGSATAASAQAQAARRAQQANVQQSFLPGFRVPPHWNQPAAQQRHRPPTPQQHAKPAASAPVQHQVQQVRTSRQAVRAQTSRTIHHANVATPVAHGNVAVPIPEARPTGLARFRPSALVAEARRYLGTNPTGRARLWCARFVNFVLKRVGQPGTGSDAAKSFAHYGRRISGPQYGAIAVLTRNGGGHVGIVTGVDRNGNPILIAGNNGRRKVGISVYPKRRVIAYVMPDGREPATAKNIGRASQKQSRYASAKPSGIR
jgi:uncharacterized protein (TIGR02594 family)